MNAATVNQAIQGATCPRCQSPLRAIDTRLPTEAFQLGPQTPEMSRPAVIVECTDDEDCRWAMEVREIPG